MAREIKFIGEEMFDLSNPVQKTRYETLLKRQTEAELHDNSVALAKRRNLEVELRAEVANAKGGMPGNIQDSHLKGPVTRAIENGVEVKQTKRGQ